MHETYDRNDILNLHLKHTVKVKVKLAKNGNECKRNDYEYFVIDPQTANYSNLRSQLARIFHIDREFTIGFRKDNSYIPLTSDWDLDGAISEASDPMLVLSVELEPIDKTLEEWDIICPADIPMENEETRCSEERKSLAGSIISQIEYTMHKVQRALSFDFSNDLKGMHSLNEDEFNGMFDAQGRLLNQHELHMAVFRSGVDPSMRPEVWKHLLNVYPKNMTLNERKEFMNKKCEEYYQLRYRWQHLMRAGTIPDVLHGITNMVRKDVRRTDRTEKFYSGSEDSGNVRALFNILTTYAVNHPNTSYCQGMSDLLSPIFYVMQKESEAYVCFCGLMKRAKSNFRLDGKSMKLKFRHLQKMLRFYDPELFIYLKDEDALDLLFCYRWLLLDLKREFPFNDMLNMMEVLWASLPPRLSPSGVKLFDVRFPTAEICDSLKDRTTEKDYFTIHEDHFGSSSDDGITFSHSVTSEETAEKIRKWTFRVRRESVARNSIQGDEIKLPIHYRKRKYRSYIAGKLGRMGRPPPTAELSIRSCKLNSRRNSFGPEICQSWSCGEAFEEKQQVRDALYDAREFLRNQWCYSNTVNEIQLNNWLNGRQLQVEERAVDCKGDDTAVSVACSGQGNCDGNCSLVSDSNRQRHGSSNSNYSAISENYSETEEVDSGNVSPTGSGTSQSEDYESDLDSKEVSRIDEDDEGIFDSGDFDSSEDFVDSMAGNQYEEVQTYFDRKKEMLPPPHVLGDGNPFLLFLCIAMIENHRTEILKRKFDFNELGIYFDKFVRKHKLPKVLRNARKMFKDYLNMGWDIEDKGEVTDDEDS